jgi:hypothetical protein
MPPAYVKTIREGVFYEYAKLISRTVQELPCFCLESVF